MEIKPQKIHHKKKKMINKLNNKRKVLKNIVNNKLQLNLSLIIKK